MYEYVYELAGAQIRDGLHILRQLPQGDHLHDTRYMMTHLPNLDIPSLRTTIAINLNLNLDQILVNPAGDA